MSKIAIHSDNDYSATSVSNIFIDEYMSDANGEFVKIYLYLLRLMNAPDDSVSLSSIADKFEHTEKDVRRALSYWERMNLLRLEYDDNQNLTGVYLLNSLPREESTVSHTVSLQTEDTPETAFTPAEAVSNNAGVSSAVYESTSEDTIDTAASQSILPEKKNYSADDIKAFREKEQVAELLFIAERYLGRTLSSTDVDTLLYLYDGLGFSTDLIEYLVEYCVTKGHISIRYIQATALKWAEQNIKTVMDAKREAQLHSKAYFAVKKAFGISGRDLVSSETDFIEKWKSDYGFSLEIISAACEKTIQSVHQPSFPYADSILKSWKKQQVHNISDINRLDQEHQNKRASEGTSGTAENPSKNKFNNFNQRSYDYDQLEKMLLTTNVQ